MLTRTASSRLIHSGAPRARASVACHCSRVSSVPRRYSCQPRSILSNSFTTSASSSSPPSSSPPSSSPPTSASTSPSSNSASTSTSTSPSSPRPFRILGLQQVAIGSLSLPALSSLWQHTFQLPYLSSFTSERENVTEHILSLGPHPRSPFAIELDIMQPLNPATTPAPHSPPLNHIGLWVDDLQAAVAWMEGPEGKVRMAPGGVRKGASGYDICFIHPKGDEKRGLRGGEGVLIELVQAPPHIIEAFEAEARRVSGGGSDGGSGKGGGNQSS